ncbi:hypothetical protein SKAU_G00138120 [Synaphobranchus kaupii]|uniref:Serglycin n=1 Tax=Synaphobranchus kaupii TaxID=118154 RepID=A0A9Q1FSD4_SYNKA|nr:hypothetical protein SKAU_G00138120 [Synaphobranchus kaupii]
MRILLNISLTLALLTLLGNTQGAPTKGRYMWVKCRPDSRNANCLTEKGPWIDLPKPNHLPSAANKITKDQSDDGSGTGQPFTETGSGDQWEKDGSDLGVFQPEDVSTDLDVSPEHDYSDFVFPQKVNLPFNQELQEESLIL